MKMWRKYYYQWRFPRSDIRSNIGRGDNLRHPVLIGERVELSSCVQVGAFTCIMEDSQVTRNCRSIGRYCSIARQVVLGSSRHPLEKLSTSGAFYTNFWKVPGVVDRKREFNEGSDLYIADDVWIGAGAIVGGGISIGTGAVIGAGAVVTKSVPPYAIVAGVPAEILRYRFDELTIAGLLRSEWWLRSPEELLPFWDDPKTFAKEYQG